MKLPADAVIAESKLTRYLLRRREEDHKSGFLAIAGYSVDNWRRLEQDIRSILSAGDAELIDVTEHGEMYHIKGRLAGPNGSVLNVITAWVRLHSTGETRFVTLIPDRETRR